MFSLMSPENNKIKFFFSGVIKWKHWPEMGSLINQ